MRDLWQGEQASFSVMQTATLFEMFKGEDDDGNDALWFDTSDGVFVMFHHQDCCESVGIEQVDGDPADLPGAFVALAEEVTKQEDGGEGSLTWTFYKLQTPRGDLTIRWLGESNGYYSESVSFYRWPDEIPEDLKPWRPKEVAA